MVYKPCCKVNPKCSLAARLYGPWSCIASCVFCFIPLVLPSVYFALFPLYCLMYVLFYSSCISSCVFCFIPLVLPPVCPFIPLVLPHVCFLLFPLYYLMYVFFYSPCSASCVSYFLPLVLPPVCFIPLVLPPVYFVLFPLYCLMYVFFITLVLPPACFIHVLTGAVLSICSEAIRGGQTNTCVEIIVNAVGRSCCIVTGLPVTWV